MAAYILNLIDLCFTLHALRHGAEELNPFMRNIPVMIAYKVVIIGGVALWLSKRQEPTARFGCSAVTAVYAAVDLWHIINLILLNNWRWLT